MKLNGHEISLGNILTILGMLAALGATWGTLSSENASMKEKLSTVEERAKEDRRNTRADIKEIKDDVRTTAEEVQKIRILLERDRRERK